MGVAMNSEYLEPFLFAWLALLVVCALLAARLAQSNGNDGVV